VTSSDVALGDLDAANAKIRLRADGRALYLPP
jgi:hypothetical protein